MKSPFKSLNFFKIQVIQIQSHHYRNHTNHKFNQWILNHKQGHYNT